ncbi:hypothetical protein KBY29_21560 [Ruegeria pomeroyi]|nr:hypothetical protein [Ruegeria pomeroyi]
MTKTPYLGMDVHKVTIAVAVADEGRSGENRFFGTIEHKTGSALRLTKQLSGAGKTPTFATRRAGVDTAYTATLRSSGLNARSLPPQGRGSGQDRSDGCGNARPIVACGRTDGDLDAGRRAGSHARPHPDAQAGDGRSKGRQAEAASFLLLHALRYENGSYWTKRHRRWLAELRRFRFYHQQLAFEE